MEMSLYKFEDKLYGLNLDGGNAICGVCLSDDPIKLYIFDVKYNKTAVDAESLMLWLPAYDIISGIYRSHEYYLDIPNKAIYIGEKNLSRLYYFPHSYRSVLNNNSLHYEDIMRNIMEVYYAGNFV